MRRFVAKYVSACLNCAYYKNTALKKRGKLYPIEKPAVPFHTIHIDHVGPFETSLAKNKFIFVLVDAFTKFTMIEPVKSTKSKIVTKILESVMCLYTTSAEKSPRLWDTNMKQIQSALNTAFNKGIETTPARALVEYQPVTTAEATLVNAIQKEVDRLDIADLRIKIKDHITDDQRKQKERYDRTRKEAKQFLEGDLVLVLVTSEPNTGTSRKLLPKYKGPFKIRKVLLSGRYEVEDLRCGDRRATTVVSVDKLKPWIAIAKPDERG